jgi:large subunit ribosomal protein L15
MNVSPSELAPDEGATHPKKRVGRGNGSGRGNYSGRGLKGQKSRSGKKSAYDAFEGGQFPSSRKYHVLRGFNNKWRVPFQPVNLESLEDLPAGTAVSPESLLAAGVIRHLNEPVKILGEGELTKSLTVTAHAFSASAKARIEELGGTATVAEFAKRARIR